MSLIFTVALVVFAVVAMVRRIRQSVASRVAARTPKKRPARVATKRPAVRQTTPAATMTRQQRKARLARAYVTEWERYTRRAARIAALLKHP